MKCKICGTKCKDIGAIGKHYRSKHPKIMARRAAASQKTARKSLKMPKTMWNMIGKANGWI